MKEAISFIETASFQENLWRKEEVIPLLSRTLLFWYYSYQEFIIIYLLHP